MTQVVQAKCPHCQNVLRIPADWLAQPMRCKFCKQVIQAKSAASATQPAVISSAKEAQSAFAVPSTAFASSSRRSSDPFSFDDAPEPVAPAPVRPRKKGKGWLVASLLLVSLTTVAILFVVFLGPQLRDLFEGKEPTPPIAQNNKAKQVENSDKASTDKAAKKGEEPTAITPKNEPNADKGSEPEVKPPPKNGDAPKKKTPIAVAKNKPNVLFPRRALLINVNNYWLLNSVHYGSTPYGGYPGSSTAVLASRFSNAPMYFPATQVTELSDSSLNPIIPQKSVIEEAISDFCNTSRDQDRIVLLFAGHAIEIDKEAYLIPYEGQKDDAKTLIPLSWVYDKLAKCNARQKIFILDAFRNPPARGFELPDTGAMTEDFEAKLHNPPPGVQVWSACSKDQQSIEFEKGSLFLQAVCNALQERIGGFAEPIESIQVEALVPKVNQRMKDLLSKTELKQESRLSGKEPDSGAAYDPTAALPPQMTLRAPVAQKGEDQAGGALVNNILEEIKKIPPMKASLKDYMKTLKAETLPPFSKKVMDFYTADYKSWGELENKLKNKDYREKFPLRSAVLEAKAALDKADALTLRETQASPITDATKKSYMTEQQEIGKMIFDLENALDTMKEAAEMRDKLDENKRWQANFDYTLARLQSRLVYVHEYNYFLADIRADRLVTLKDGESGWRIGFEKKLSTNESKVKNMFKDIGKLWKKIADEHPNTPWALLAQRESRYAMGLVWRASRD